MFIGRTDVEAATPVLWPPDAKSWLIWKAPSSGKDWRQDQKGMTEDEMVGWHHQLNGHGFGWTLGVGDGQGGLAYCDSWGRKESDMTEQLNWTEACTYEVSLIAQWERIRLPKKETQVWFPGLGRSPGEGNGNPLQHSWPGNPMDRGTWQATVHGVAESWTRLSD